MKHSRPTWMILAALAALALAVAGCSAGNGESGSGGRAPSAIQNDVNPVARDQLQDGGSLRWPLTGLPPNFNYHELSGPDVNNAAVIGALLPSPFDFDAAAQPTLRRVMWVGWA